MRPLAILSFSFIAGLQAQSMLDHGAAMSGAAVGAAAGKPMSDAITKIFGQTDADAKKAAKAPAKPAAPAATPKATAKTAGAPAAAEAADTPKPSSHRSRSNGDGGLYYHMSTGSSARVAAEPMPVAIPAKVPTVEELGTLKQGASESEMVSLLGQPGSRVSVPDDDGHLRESCQYFANGQQIGTVRLDNGQVVTVHTNN